MRIGNDLSSIALIFWNVLFGLFRWNSASFGVVVVVVVVAVVVVVVVAASLSA